MKRTLVIFLLLTGSAWSATTESVRAVCDSLDRLGERGPAVLWREYTGGLEQASTATWTVAEKMTAMLNMGDFCTSPPRRPLQMQYFDWAQLVETLSAKEIDLIEAVCKIMNVEEMERMMDEARSWQSGEQKKLNAASTGAPAAVERKLRWRLYQ